ncbi:hypothetical protein ACFXPS_40520 [Nocardia sp. NPDC059091]|uniref:hypothetical protein n=1 Tax=unclassified Nocardia TaxID=2637762 RepID=UPI0036AD3CBF
MRIPATQWLRAGWRLIRLPLIPIVLYLALRPVLAALSERHGFGSPDGMSVDYLAVAATLMALRIVLLVIVPAYLSYRVVAYTVTRLLRRGDSQNQSEAVDRSPDAITANNSNQQS